MNDKIETKTYHGRMEFKKDDGQEGYFSAVFATLNVIDHHDDVTLPGAFGKQDVLVEPWNHGWDLPVGIGTIHEDGEEAVAEGKFFMDIPEANNHYVVAKELSDKQQWSYTFRIVESRRGQHEGQDVRFLEKLEVIGISQVSEGAGINTRTTDIKSALKNLMKSAPGDAENEEETASNDADDSQDHDDSAGGADPVSGTESESGDPANESGGVDPETYHTLIEIELEELS